MSAIARLLERQNTTGGMCTGGNHKWRFSAIHSPFMQICSSQAHKVQSHHRVMKSLTVAKTELKPQMLKSQHAAQY